MTNHPLNKKSSEKAQVYLDLEEYEAKGIQLDDQLSLILKSVFEIIRIRTLYPNFQVQFFL